MHPIRRFQRFGRHVLYPALLVAAFFAAVALADEPVSGNPRFAIKGGEFLRDGKPFVIRSGEMHYPRIPREFWRERLRQARAMGLNSVTTYVFWNLHEPEPGRFDFSGNLDIAAFIRTAREEGLDTIVRPGPYICSELDFGGFPAWLLRTPGLRVRSLDPRFLQASAAYLKRVGTELAPLLSTRGGPVLMVQIENEYGSYGRDRDYMLAIRQQMLAAGFDLPLFTSDGPGPYFFDGGPLPDVTAVINFAGDVAEAKASFAHLKDFRPDGPRMVGEYWAGWFDHWGEEHHRTDPKQEARTLEWFLDNDISFNIYMFHGGTNWGFLAGANYSRETPYQPDTTSYDYDAPVDEAGRLTPKYHLLREVIGKHLPAGESLPTLPAAATRAITIARFDLPESVALLDALPVLSKPVRSQLPRNMEQLDQNHGLILYRKTFANAARGKLIVDEVRDYAVVLADGVPLGTLDRRLAQRELAVDLKSGQTLDLLVENMGRINFGPRLDDERKGITRFVALDEEDLLDWQIYPLPLHDLSRLVFTLGAKPRGPAFWRGSFELDSVGNTFLDTRGWGKGHVWVNGHHLGRHWQIGPQQTLFVPAPWLRRGRNEVIVLDMQSGATRSLQGLKEPVFEPVDSAAKVSN